MLHSLENLFHEWEIDASAEDLAPLRLARLAVSQKVPFSKLERLLMLHDFDGARVIEEIRPEGRVASSGQSSTVSQERPSQLAASIEPEIPSFKLFIHREGEKEPFNSWYNDLQKSQKNRVHAALKKFVEGHLGNVKKLSTRAKSEADVSAYEIKIKDSGMRLYFRYLPNHRVILLGGGDKHTQERDIPLVMERAAHYNGSNKTLSENLSELDI
jgi:putative addiction module killer protein